MSDKNTITQNWHPGAKMLTTVEETDVEKAQPFRGSRGQLCEAKRRVLLKWCPFGSDKWITTEFLILADGKSVVTLGKEFVDLRGIFHDMDFDISPFRLPGSKNSRGEYCVLIHVITEPVN